jgi:hypothetical protein
VLDCSPEVSPVLGYANRTPSQASNNAMNRMASLLRPFSISYSAGRPSKTILAFLDEQHDQVFTAHLGNLNGIPVGAIRDPGKAGISPGPGSCCSDDRYLQESLTIFTSVIFM